MKREKAQLPPKPDNTKLKEILKGVISASDVQRVNALTKALQWYSSSAVIYVIAKQKGKLTAEQTKQYASETNVGIVAQHRSQVYTKKRHSRWRFDTMRRYAKT